jgi:hypothetical protein
MDSNKMSTHYDVLKVSKNAKQYIIDAAYQALLDDINSLKNIKNNDEILKAKEILDFSYIFLSDPIRRADYDKELKNGLIREELLKPSIVEGINIEQLDRQVNKEKVFFMNKDFEQTKHIKATFISISLISICIASYIWYVATTNTSHENTNLPKLKIEDPNFSSEDKSVNIANSDSLSSSDTTGKSELIVEQKKIIQDEKSYSSAIEEEKRSDIERLNSRQNRRDNLLTRQENIDFESFEQQAQNKRNILKAEAENIAIMQKTLQDYDMKIQEKILENSRLEQEEADVFAKAESAREIEIKKILAEQIEIERLLVDNDRKSRELTNKLVNM